MPATLSGWLEPDMVPKRIIILSLLFIALAGLVYWQVNISIQSPKKDTHLISPNFDPQHVSKIYFNKAGNKRELEREGTQWYLVFNRRLPANREMVEQALNALKHAQPGDLITEDEQKYSLFQLDSSGLEVRISLAGNKTLAEFMVGKPGPDYASTYFRRKNSKGVWLIKGNLRLFDQPDWVERRILIYKPADIAGIKLEYPNEAITLALKKMGRQWHMSEPEKSQAQADKVQSFLDDLLNLRILDYAGEQDYDVSGLNNPKIKLTLFLTSGQTLGLLIGGDKDSNITYARIAGQSGIILLPGHRISMLQKKPEDFLETGG